MEYTLLTAQAAAPGVRRITLTHILVWAVAIAGGPGERLQITGRAALASAHACV